MAKIIGGTTATPMLNPDWNQTNPNRSDYIKNKPNMDDYATTKYVDVAIANLPSGGVSFSFVTELPTTGETDTIYLLPANPQTESNLYDEYIFANGKWEKIGSASVEVNLDEYVKKTDYATGSKAGVVKSNKTRCFIVDSNGVVSADILRASEYSKTNTGAFLGIGTYENNKSQYVKEGITTNTIALTDEEKATACNWLGAVSSTPKEYELINTITVTPYADGSLPQKVIFSEDNEGNAFELTDFYVVMTAGFTDGSKSSFYMGVNNMGYILGNVTVGFVSDALRCSIAYFESGEEGVTAAVATSGPSPYIWNSQLGLTRTTKIPQHDDALLYMLPVRIITLETLLGDNKTWIEGSTFELYGVRK